MLTFWFANNTNILALGNPSTCGPAHKPKCEGVNLLLSSDGIFTRDSGENKRTLVGAWRRWERRQDGCGQGGWACVQRNSRLSQKV